jgi:hypothetical protein
LISGCDFSNLDATVHLVLSTAQGFFTFRNCKLPASWSGSLYSAAPAIAITRAELYNCDSGDTNYRLWIEDYYGSIKHETTLIKTGGASDGTTGLSWVMASSANADEFSYAALISGEIVKWNETLSAITVTVDILHDSVTNLQNDEIWLEVQYLGTSGFPLSLFVSDGMVDILATPADQTDSSSTWTTTGMTNPNTQQLNVTFTPAEKGFIHATVHVAKASYVVYIDPVLQVS